MLPNPDNSTQQEWADAVVVEYSETPVPTFNGDFNGWTSSLLSLPPFNTQVLPRPEMFKSWRIWARVVQGILER